MQGFWILLLAVQMMYSCAGISTTDTRNVELMHGQQFSIRLPTESEKLEFISSDNSQKGVLWARMSVTKRGIVIGKDSDRRFSIASVMYEDQGIYTLYNFWSKTISTHLLKVVPNIGIEQRVAGETLRISLGGLSKNDATLQFSNRDYNLTLVSHGTPVGSLNAEYMGRIQLTSSSFELRNVNVSDEGTYILRDNLNRKLKIVTMVLVDHHEGVSAGPFMGLLMLLGIPPCIFCCCRKKICKKNNQPTTTVNTPPNTVNFDNQINPPGPPPAYPNIVAPANPSAYTPGYPAIGGNVVHPPPNPTFPNQPPYSGYAMPPNPASNPVYPPESGFPPAQPPQWSGAPYNPPAPAGIAPMMYSAPAGPEPVNGEINPTTPLLVPPQPLVSQPSGPYSGANVPNSSDSAVQFSVNMGKDSSLNFL